MDEMDHSEPMTVGELRMVMAYLGLNARTLGEQIESTKGRTGHVLERKVREWLAGDRPVPEWAREQIESLEGFTATCVEAVVRELHDQRDPALRVTLAPDEQVRPGPHTDVPLPPSWWVMVCARACQDVPGVEIA